MERRRTQIGQDLRTALFSSDMKDSLHSSLTTTAEMVGIPLRSDIIHANAGFFCSSPDSSYRGSSTDSSTPGASPDIDVVSATPMAPQSLLISLETYRRRTLPPSISDGGVLYRQSNKESTGGPIKRYLCQRCLNHNEHWPRKGHKPFCQYASCACRLCRMVDERRRLNNAICRQANSAEDEGNSDTAGVKIRNPMCARCSAHGVQNRLRGHKKRCPYTKCECNLCKLVDERRELMARQIKLRRHQKQEIFRQKSLEVEVPANHPIMTGGQRGMTSFMNSSATTMENLGHYSSPIFSSANIVPPTSLMSSQTGSSMNNFFNLPSTISQPHSVSSQAVQAPHYHASDLSSQINNNLLRGLMAGPGKREMRQPISLRSSLNSAIGGNLTLPLISAPPTQQTVLVPVSMAGGQSGHFGGTNSHNHVGCIACLEEALRHELKMAELLRILAATAHATPGVQHNHSHSLLTPNDACTPAFSQAQPISADLAALINQSARNEAAAGGTPRGTSCGDLGKQFPDISIPSPPLSLANESNVQETQLDTNAVENFYRIMHQHPNVSLSGLPLSTA